MTSKAIQDLSNELTRHDFFDRLSSGVDDWDALLDKRDSAEFDDAWVKSNEAVSKKKYLDQSDEAEINNLREYAFKAVFRITGNSETAGYVSDDIGLICESAAKDNLTGWVNELLKSYRAGNFPC